MTNTNHKISIKLVIVLVILLITGSLFGVAMARFTEKNLLVVEFHKKVRLAEDIYISHPERQISDYYKNTEHGNEGTPLYIPAGTEGSVNEYYWYYNVYSSNGDYNEFIRKKLDSVYVTFKLEEGRIGVQFTSVPSESNGNKPTSVFSYYVEEFDAVKLEGFDTTLKELNETINEYHSKWIYEEILGGIKGLAVSLVVAGFFVLVNRKSNKVTKDNVLFGIVTAIDIILIIADAFFLYVFTRLL